MVNLAPIGYLRGPFTEKFGTPRQPGLIPEVEGVVELLAPWNTGDAVRGLEDFSHVWLLFGFHLNSGSAPARTTVRPPRLGGNERLGVFATRAPYRPNPIGLSLVSLRAVAASKLVVGGFDLVDGTPVYDIKPWLPWADLPTQEGSGGFASQPPVPRLMVGFDGGLADDPLAPVLARVLAFDPRPAYQRGDADRIYGMDYAGYEIQWRVDDLNAELQVTAIRKSVDKVPE